MTAVTSAGLLAYRVRAGALQVFLVHMGGPYWAHKEDGAWSVPKGEYDAAREDAALAAAREFAEEVGVPAPEGQWQDLGVFVGSSRKRNHVFAVETGADLRFVASNTFRMRWPPGFGQLQEFPEVDRAEWFDLAAARRKLVPGQVPVLDALKKLLGTQGAGTAP